MKSRHNPFLNHAVIFTACSLITFATSATAATQTWAGDVDNDFMNGANWATDPALPSLSADTWQINGLGSVNTNPILNVSSPLTFAGTAGKIAFGATSGSMSISGSDITLFQGTGDGILSATSGTTTISNNLIIGNGSLATNSISNSNISGGLLKVTGNITGGTGGTAGILTLSFGSTDSQDGNYEVTGNITKGATATAMTVTMRGDGTATLSGTNSFNTLGWGGTAGTIGKVRINGGTTDAGTIAGSGLFTQTLRVSSGVLNAGTARNVRTSILVDGGTMNISGDRLSFNNSGQTLTVSGGALNVNGTGSNTYGARLGGDANGTAGAGYGFTGTQSGGTFTVKGNGGLDTTFSLGSITESITTSYSLSGGTLDVLGSNSANGWVTIGADAAGTSTTTLNLSGTGKLISRFDPGLTTGGIVGKTADAKQVLSLTGGTLVAGRIDATNLRGSVGGINGTIVNNGTSFAPGDVGTVGRTNIVGNMSVSTGTLTIDLSGLTASTVFSEAPNLGTFDNLLISGNLSLAGNLGLNLVNGYEPQFTDVFKIIDIGGTLSNFFGNVADGGTLTTLGSEGTFKVYSSNNDVFLTNFTVIPEPRAALLGGIGLLALLRRRRS